MTEAEFSSLARARRGHFRYESGFHSDLWLDLEALFSKPAAMQPHTEALAQQVARLQCDVICGALIEGAFVALQMSQLLHSGFAYTVRIAERDRVRYEVPKSLETAVRGARVLIANDVISAGSAVRGTFASLRACGAEIVGIASLVTMGGSFAEFVAEHQLANFTLLHIGNNLWNAGECPLCRAGVPLESLAAY